jgi:phosphate-selective porin OprO/OprP
MYRMRYLAGAAALCTSLSAGGAWAEEGLEAGRRGLVYETENFELNLGGRLHLDAAQIDDGGVDIEDEKVRRARVELSLEFFDDWRLRVDREFTNDGGWRNVWLSYDVNDDLTIKAGNFIAPFSMEDVGSSNETMFMERSLAQALAPGFGVGIGASYEGRHFGLSGGYFGDAIDTEDNIQAEKGQGVALRGTWSPMERRSNTLHFGVGLERREFDTGDFRTMSSGPEASLAPTAVSTGALANLDTSSSYNFEMAYSAGPVLFQGQYISTTLARTIGPDVEASGYYAQVGWVLTGERYRYGDAAGVFTGPHPRNAWGAVELTARLSSLDVSEAGAPNSGQVDDYTMGANWYLGRNFRLMANYVHSEVDAVNPLLDRDVDVVQARAQIDF